MSQPFPALCMHCRHSKPEESRSSFHRCFHPVVVSKDAWALSANKEGQPSGTSCYDERRKRSIFAPCGMRGKLWEAK
jgi:hypothetical protein